ncbi:MAG: acetyltransferase [bacterium]
MEEVVIFGTGELAEVIYFLLSESKEYKVVAFTVDREYLKEDKIYGLPVLPFEDIEKYFSCESVKMFIAVGYSKLNMIREQKFLEAKKKGYSCITYIHPSATVASNVKIGENCFIFEDNTIQPFVTIEDNCILWSGNHIGHHTTIRKNCFVTSHVVISGGCEIGQNTFIGVNATLRDHIKIGKFNVIGAGAIILSSTEDNQVFISQRTEPANITSDKLKRI